jgi:hypothetical protein
MNRKLAVKPFNRRNDKRPLSTVISKRDWKKLTAKCPPSMGYILKGLRARRNTPTSFWELDKKKPDGDIGAAYTYPSLSTWLRKYFPNFTLRKVEDIGRPWHGSIVLCRAKRQRK